jgi:hypothetical protein
MVQSDAELFQVIAALHPVGGFTDLLYGREQQPHQDGDNGDHDQQLDQGKCTAPIHRMLPSRKARPKMTKS